LGGTFFVDFGMGGYSLTVLQFTKSWRTPALSKSKLQSSAEATASPYI